MLQVQELQGHLHIWRLMQSDFVISLDGFKLLKLGLDEIEVVISCAKALTWHSKYFHQQF